MSNLLRLAILQLKVGSNKVENVTRAIDKIRAVCASHKPRVIALPECFNCPYGTAFFNDFSEEIPAGYTSESLSKIAKELDVYVIGGSIPERVHSTEPLLYNTCTIWSPSGELIGKHRKVHLFDIDIKGGVRFKESNVLNAGDNLTMVDIDGIRVGIGICYDIRFEEMARLYRNKGCKMIVYPGAFNMTTGPMHWELLQRGRANDNQLYVATVSPARDETAKYVAYGHSMAVDPWGKVLASASSGEETLVVDLDFDVVEQVREQIPVFSQRRTDIYDTVTTKKL